MASEKKSKIKCSACEHRMPCPTHCNDDQKHHLVEGYCMRCGHYDGSSNGHLDLSTGVWLPDTGQLRQDLLDGKLKDIDEAFGE